MIKILTVKTLIEILVIIISNFSLLMISALTISDKICISNYIF